MTIPIAPLWAFVALASLGLLAWYLRSRLRLRAAEIAVADRGAHAQEIAAENLQLPMAQRTLAAAGFLVLMPDQLPGYAGKLGYVVLTRDQFGAVLQAICTRTNIDGQAEEMLRKAGLIE